jgi:hypothetical protein
LTDKTEWAYCKAVVAAEKKTYQGLLETTGTPYLGGQAFLRLEE